MQRKDECLGLNVSPAMFSSCNSATSNFVTPFVENPTTDCGVDFLLIPIKSLHN